MLATASTTAQAMKVAVVTATKPLNISSSLIDGHVALTKGPVSGPGSALRITSREGSSCSMLQKGPDEGFDYVPPCRPIHRGGGYGAVAVVAVDPSCGPRRP